jgi:hypothetical protein
MQITRIQGVSGSVKETGYHIQDFCNILTLPKQMTLKFALTYNSADNTSLTSKSDIALRLQRESLEVTRWNHNWN